MARQCARSLIASQLRGLVLALGAVVFLASTPAAATAGPDGRKLVVVLYPEDTDGSPGTVSADHAIRSVFAMESPKYVEVRNEYVVSRARDPEIKRLQCEYLRRKYAGRKIDLVIAALSSALDFALDNRSEIFPDVPVVCCAVDPREFTARKLPPDVIGIPVRIEMAATLDVALRLHPETRRVFVVAGNAPFDLAWEAEARRTFQPYEDRLEFTYLTGLPMDDLLGRVASLPERCIVYYLHAFQDGAGKVLVPADALELLASRANAPIYGHSDVYVGRGAVGGRMISLENEGKNAARLGLRILAGEKPETIPHLEASENANVFDWRQLKRWGIDEKRLPPGSFVRYREHGFWELYQWHVVGAISLCVIESLLIAGLLIQLVKRRRADQRFRQVVETAPIGMLMVGRDGKIVMVNAQVEKLFGYGKEELLGQPVELLVPENARGRHSSELLLFFAAPEVRTSELGRDLFGRRKDGGEFPIEVGLSPLKTPRGLFVLASVIDLTGRRRAEDGLRASQRELQLLTGRLLEAQEVERRRIARELHDDFNQSLALLSVEMDLLGRKPPNSGAELAVRLIGLSARIQDLSSAVHDLSHQLHPSKLEQLGLVVAIKGLCREQLRGHGLEARFTHDEVPGDVPADVALCLYRIVQEALRNVVKHSGTSQVAVELHEIAGEIRLKVTDEGAGFDSSAASGGLGLISMRERLNLVGGKLVIVSRPSAGTRIDVRVPNVVPDRREREGSPTQPPDGQCVAAFAPENVS